VAKINRKLSKR